MQRRYLGLISYSSALEAQAEALVDECAGRILGLEHPAVITLGLRGQPDGDLLVPAAALAAKGIELVKTDRGGQATLHSPGQLVIYPCLDLKVLGIGAREYVCLVQSSTRRWLERLGVKAEACGGEPGLYVGDRKLAAFGFKISRGRTSHGLAINVANDLGLFQLIRPCGALGQPLTRLADLGISASLPELFSSWCDSFLAALPGPRLDSAAGPPVVSGASQPGSVGAVGSAFP